jgi:hypothetical protein
MRRLEAVLTQDLGMAKEALETLMQDFEERAEEP